MKTLTKSIKETTPLFIGELAVAALTALGFAIASIFTEVNIFSAIAGAALGAVVSVLNYLFLSVSVNRSVDSYLQLRGTKEMSDEEAEKFTNEHSMKIQNAVKTSFLIRTASILAVLVLAFITGWFSPIATAIPLLSYRPILTVSEMIISRISKKSNTTAGAQSEISAADAPIIYSNSDFTESKSEKNKKDEEV